MHKGHVFNNTYYTFHFSVAGGNSEAAHSPADPKDGQVGKTGAAQAEEQEDGGHQNKEPVTEKPTQTTAEKGTDGFDIDMTLIYLSKCTALFDHSYGVRCISCTTSQKNAV